MKIIIELNEGFPGLTVKEGNEIYLYLKKKSWCKQIILDFEKEKDNDKKGM